MFFSNIVLSNDNIFELMGALSESEFIAQVSNIEQVYLLKNPDKQTIFRYALSENLINIAKRISKLPNYEASRKDVFFVAKKLFSLKLNLRKNNQLSEHSVKIGHLENIFKLSLESSVKLKEYNISQDEDIVELSCRASNYFSTREEIAYWLKRRYFQEKISDEKLAIIRKYYKQLFFENDPLTKKSLKKIIEIFYGFLPNKFLIEFIFYAYEKERLEQNDEKKVEIKEESDEEIQLRDKYREDSLVTAIFYKDVKFFEDYRTEKILERHNADPVRTWHDDLGKIVKLSILWGGSKVFAKRKYLYWIQVVKKLKQKDDYYGAGAISRALMAQEIERVIGEKLIKKHGENFSFIDPSSNFVTFRRFEEQFHENKFYLPDIGYINSIIGMYAEVKWLQAERMQIASINVDSLIRLVELGENLKKYRRSAKKTLINSNYITKRISDMPFIEDNFLIALSLALIPYKQNFSADNIKRWDVYDISCFVNNQVFLNEQEKSALLRYIYIDMGISNGYELLTALCKESYLTVFSLNLNLHPKLPVIEQEKIITFFNVFHAYVEEQKLNLDEFKEAELNTGRLKYKPIKKFYEDVFNSDSKNLRNSDPVDSLNSERSASGRRIVPSLSGILNRTSTSLTNLHAHLPF